MGNLILIQMDQHQQIMGTHEHFLSLPSTRLPYGERSRTQFLWEQNKRRGAKLFIKGAWKQTVTRENDVFLMNDICSTPRPAYILECLNDVRLWLKVARLSDISNPEDTQIIA